MKKIKRELVHELVAREIQQYIIEQNLQEGDKLPSLEKLGTIMGVGRSSLREALRYLEATELVETVNGKGVYVKDFSSYRLSAKIKADDIKQTLLHTCEVRRLIEGSVVELACAQATAEQIKEMQGYVEEIRHCADQKQDNSASSIKLLRAIYRSCGNPVLESISQSLWNMFDAFWNTPFDRSSNRFEGVVSILSTLTEAIQMRDPLLARSAHHQLMDTFEAMIHKIDEKGSYMGD